MEFIFYYVLLTLSVSASGLLFLEKRCITYSTHNKENFVITKRCIRTFAYIDKLDGVVNKYNNTYHRTVKMKPVSVISDTYIDFN